MKFSTITCFLLALILLSSCKDSLVYSEYKPTSNGSWSREDVKEFEISEIDSLDSHNLYIMIRNDNTFPYSNLFLIAELNTPDDRVVRDTMEFEMARPDGSWLGKGAGSVIENKLWYKENIVFTSPGVYKIQLSHAMRQNGKVEGINNLKGITDVGIEVERREQ